MMKKLICVFIAVMMPLLALAGCTNAGEDPAPVEQIDPAPVEQGDPEELSAYLTGDSNEEYTLKENVTLDLTGIHISQDKTILLQDTTLTFIGTLSVGTGCIAVQSCGGIKPTVDMSALAFSFESSQEERIFEIHSDVEFVPPDGQDGVVLEQNDNWTSIKIFSDNGSQPVGENVTAATAEELNRFLSNPDVSNIELSDSIALDCSGSSLSRNVTVICGNYALALSGSLAIEHGGLLVVDAGPDATGTLDITQFSVTANGANSADSSTRTDLVQIRMNFKQITGEPMLTGDLAYEISSDGSQAFICPKTDPVSTEQVIHDFTQVLSGEKTEGDDLPDALPLQDTVDGILEIRLDDPLITEEIALTIEGGVTLKLTGSVTFDGGLYRFDFAEGSSGRVTVDMTELTINATGSVGKTKSDNIVFWRERNGVDVLFDGSSSHLSYVLGGSGNDELRYVR